MNGLMNQNAGKVLIVESDESLRQQIAAALSDAGHDVSTAYRGGMKAVLAFGPDAMILGADPSSVDVEAQRYAKAEAGASI